MLTTPVWRGTVSPATSPPQKTVRVRRCETVPRQTGVGSIPRLVVLQVDPESARPLTRPNASHRSGVPPQTAPAPTKARIATKGSLMSVSERRRDSCALENSPAEADPATATSRVGDATDR